MLWAVLFRSGRGKKKEEGRRVWGGEIILDASKWNPNFFLSLPLKKPPPTSACYTGNCRNNSKLFLFPLKVRAIGCQLNLPDLFNNGSAFSVLSSSEMTLQCQIRRVYLCLKMPEVNNYHIEIPLETDTNSPSSVFIYIHESFVTLTSGFARPYSRVPIPWPRVLTEHTRLRTHH